MREIIKKYFSEITEEQIIKLEKLAEIFPAWNDKINCISRKDIENIFINHILHSLSIAKIFKFEDNSKVVDIGTGGGFPGIPLAIMFPQVKFDLVDSIGKKITVVENIASQLELSNIRALNLRAEKLSSKYDYIVSRAVTSFPEFVKITANLIDKNSRYNNIGTLYIKGGDFTDEVKEFERLEIHEIYDFFPLEFYKTKKIIYLPAKKTR